jgi:hypothetical protein
VYDFIDPDIEEKLAALEAEEEKLEAEGFYESEDELEDAEEADIRYKAELIREKRVLIRNEAKMRKSLKNRAVIPRSAKAVKMSQMESQLQSLGFDTTNVAKRAQSQNRGRSLVRQAENDAMDTDKPKSALEKARSRDRSQSTNRRNDGVPDPVAATKAERLAKLSQKKMNRNARQGEGDRHQTGSLIKHLVRFAYVPPILNSLTIYTDGWKAWYRKDQQQISAGLVRVPTRLFSSNGVSGKTIMIMIGVQGALDTRLRSVLRSGQSRSHFSIAKSLFKHTLHVLSWFAVLSSVMVGNMISMIMTRFVAGSRIEAQTFEDAPCSMRT